MAMTNPSDFFRQCAKSDSLCEDSFTECFTREESECYVRELLGYLQKHNNIIQLVFMHMTVA